MVLDLNHEEINVDEIEEEVKPDVELKLKLPKAHERGIVEAFFQKRPDGIVHLITIGNDVLKVWSVRETDSGSVEMDELESVKKWRCGVQAADFNNSTQYLVVVGLDSVVYEVLLGNGEPSRVIAHDLGYMEAWQVQIVPRQSAFITTSFSNNLSEVDADGKVARKEPFGNVKHVTALAYSHAGSYIAVGMLEGQVRLVDANTLKEIQSFEVHSVRVRTLLFCPDETFFVTGSDDKTIKLHSVGGEKQCVIKTLCGHRHPVTCLALDPRSRNRRLASGSAGGEVHIWDLEQGTPQYILPTPHDALIGSVRFHPNGRHLVSVGEDKVIAVYSIPQSGEPSPDRIDDDMNMEEYNDRMESSEYDKENLEGVDV